VLVGGTRLALTPAQRSALTSEDIVVGVRPEGWETVRPEDGIAGIVEVVEELGSDQYLYCKAESGQTLTVRTPGMAPWLRGEKIGLSPKPGTVHFFDTASGYRLPDA
jgi:multiple sugar transport system ATP-binding protein